MKANTLAGMALLALGVTFWLATHVAAWLASPPAPLAPDLSETAPATTSPQSLVPQLEHGREAVDPATAPSGTRPADVLDTVRLELIDVLGAPVPDADVRYLPPMPDDERDIAQNDPEVQHDHELMLQRHGRVTRPDANGFIDLIIAPGSCVTARVDERFAIVWPDPSPAGMPRERVTLRPDVTLRVQVVDRSGAPIPGLDLFAISDGRSRRRGVFGYDAQIGPTDAQGSVLVPHLQEKLELPQPGAEGRLRVRLGGRWQSRRMEFAEHTFAAAELHGDVTMRLVTDSAGTIAVRTLDADGEPIEANASLEYDTGEGFEPNPTARDGALWFTPVPTGRKWCIDAYVHNWPGAAVRQQVTGPAVNGATTRVDVQLPMRQFRISARVVDGAGVPVPHATVTLLSPQARELRPAVAAAREPATTDDDGDFSSGHLHTDAEAKTLDLTVTVTSPLTTPRTFAFRALPKGEHELGDLVVPRQPGQPLLAAVELRCDGKPPTGRCNVVLQQIVTDGSRRRAMPVLAMIDRDGATFSFYGPVPEHPMRLSCWSTDGVRQVIDSVPPGARRVVDLVRNAELILAVEPPDVPHDEVRGVLTPLGTDQGSGEWLDAEQQVFWWTGVPPGRYSLQISVAGKTLWSCPSLELATGVNRLPADGSRLDLRGLAEARLLQVFSTLEHEPLRYEAISIGQRALELDEENEQQHVWQWFLLRQPREDLLIRAFEHVPMRVSAPDDDVTVTLQRSVQLTLDLPDEYDQLHGRLIFDPIADPVLRAFDDYHVHAAEFAPDDTDLRFVPGSVVEFCVERDGKRGRPVRVTVGAEAPPPVQLR